MKKLPIALSLFLVLLFGCQEEPVQPDASVTTIQKEHYGKFLPFNEFKADKSLDLSNLEFRNPVRSENYSLQVIEETSSLSRGNAVYKVYPTGNFPDDLDNLQVLVNELGEEGKDAMIKLKATNLDGVPTEFNFGYNSGVEDWVFVNAVNGRSGSLKIMGEEYNGAVTTINGGRSFNGSFLFFGRESDEFSLQNIKFINQGGLTFLGIGQMTIKGCVFENSIFPLNSFGNNGPVQIIENSYEECVLANRIFGESETLEVKNNIASNVKYGYFIDVSLKLIFKNNETYTSGEFDSPGGGLSIAPFTGASVDIKDNVFSGTESISMEIGSYIGPVSNINIRNNTFETYNENYWSSLVLFDAGNPIDGVEIKDNIFKGTSSSAIWISGAFSFVPPVGTSNVVIKNNSLEEFTSNCTEYSDMDVPIGCVDIYFSTTTFDNFYCGDTENIIDEGTNNTIKEGC